MIVESKRLIVVVLIMSVLVVSATGATLLLNTPANPPTNETTTETTTSNPQDNPTLYMFRDQDLLNYSFSAPNWEFPGIDGTNRTISQYAGKWLVLDFFATWCYYCKLQNPAMVKLHDKYSSNVLQILHITTSLGDSQAMLEDYADEHGITWPIVYGTDDVAADYFRIIGIPTTAVIDPNGIIRWINEGTWSFDDLNSTISALMGQE